MTSAVKCSVIIKNALCCCLPTYKGLCVVQTMEELKDKGQPLPRVLYLVPNGQNPVSYVAPLERRQALYQTSRKYDLMIVEDDPYFYLQFPYNSTLIFPVSIPSLFL